MDYAETAALAANATWRGRVTACAVRVAIAVVRETPGDEDAGQKIPHRRKRAQLCADVLANPAGYTDRLAWDVAVAVMILGGDGTVTDAQLETAIRRGWDALAGISYEDRTGQ